MQIHICVNKMNCMCYKSRFAHTQIQSYSQTCRHTSVESIFSPYSSVVCIWCFCLLNIPNGFFFHCFDVASASWVGLFSVLSPGCVCDRSGSPSLHLPVHLRLLSEEREGAAADRSQELWPQTRGHRQVRIVHRLLSAQMLIIFTRSLVSSVLQRPGPEETHLPEDGLLRTLWQEGVSLGGPKEPGVLTWVKSQIPAQLWGAAARDYGGEDAGQGG